VSYTGVVDAPKLSKNDLFDNAKKWIKTKHSEINPYTVTYESMEDGSVIGKGSVALPADRRKYTMQFVLKVSTKDGKFKYEFTDFIVQFRTQAGSSSGGYGGWGGSSYREAETLEYSLETFYPSRLNSRKPAIKWFEEINRRTFESIGREMQSVISSFQQSMKDTDDW
jgi:hypothetical protein